MAFVALVSASMTLIGVKTGTVHVLAFTKATAVGFCTFENDGQTFWNVPLQEDVVIADAYVGDTVNAGDSLDLYVNSVPTGRKFFEKALAPTNPSPRLRGPRIKAGAKIALYHNSA